MNPISIRGLTLGGGACRVIVPLVETTHAAIVRRAAQVAALAPDLLEWRADWFDAVWDTPALTACLHQLRAAVGELPLLVTFRTQREGGRQPASPGTYERFCRIVCESGCADLLDVELFTEDGTRQRIFDLAHAHGVRVVCSSHDFDKTPPRQEMVDRLCRMQALGADIAKLAVMPRSRQDVAALLAATAEMAELHPQTPVITMSMGALGQISRMAGGTFGSAATFAAAGSASAPGQPALEDVRAMLALLEGR